MPVPGLIRDAERLVQRCAEIHLKIELIRLSAPLKSVAETDRRQCSVLRKFAPFADFRNGLRRQARINFISAATCIIRPNRIETVAVDKRIFQFGRYIDPLPSIH